MKHARPRRAITQSAVPAGTSVRGATRNAATGGQIMLCPYQTAEPGGGKGFSQSRSFFASG
jgi:hypothetical protein